MKLLQSRADNRPVGDSQIVKGGVRLMVPFIQLFGLYIIVHGHYSPGGGFQGGVVLSSSFILLALAYDLKTSIRHFPVRVNAVLSNIGPMIYTGVAFLCAVMGGMFLDYSALNKIIPLGLVEWRSFGIFLVEVGVGLAVMSIMLSLFWDLCSGGELDEGL
jgi:multicomponent Na+:H+ antiporter subunit B